jgi:hypothetical protein
MLIYDSLLVILGLKKKTVPAKENWIAYANFKHSHAYNLFSDSNFFLLLMIIMTCFFYYFFFAVFICCYYRFLSRFRNEINYKYAKDYISYSLVNCIQVGHNQTLKEHLMADPSQIDCRYKKKSLLHWACFYRNHEAHNLILKLMKERAAREITRQKSPI